MLLQQIAREARRTKPEWKHGRDTSLDQRLDEVVEFFGASTRLEDITTKRVYEFVTALEARRGRKGSLSPKTIVQYTTNRPEMPWQRESGGVSARLTPRRKRRCWSIWTAATPSASTC